MPPSPPPMRQSISRRRMRLGPVVPESVHIEELARVEEEAAEILEAVPLGVAQHLRRLVRGGRAAQRQLARAVDLRRETARAFAEPRREALRLMGDALSVQHTER